MRALFLFYAAMCWGLWTNAKHSDPIVCVGGLYYSLQGSNAKVEMPKGERYSGNVTVPETIEYNGKTYIVNAIGVRAFQSSTFDNVELPNTIEYIDAFAFSFSDIMRINLPHEVDAIHTTAFYRCSGLETVDGIRYANDFLVGVVDSTRSTYNIKNGTRHIGSNAFNGLKNLQSIMIPESVKEVGSFAFSGCTNLKEVYFAGKECKLLEYAFSSCISLAKVKLPKKCELDEQTVFRGSGSQKKKY